GFRQHVPRSGPNALHSQGYTKSICTAIMKSVDDGRKGQMQDQIFVNVSIAAKYLLSKVAPVCVCAYPPTFRRHMASRHGPSETADDIRI
ncbi:MAG: hypothetical protein ACKPKO_49060, partial [Candidatus Fonsibacter sp.]